MKYLPNAITIARILGSLSLCFLHAHRGLFVAVYLLCGITDVLDGRIARRFGVGSALGAKLDSVADFVLFAVSLYAIVFFVQGAPDAYVLVLFLIVVAVRAVNLALVRVKFAQWGIVHTYGNKAAGLALFAAIPFCVYANSYPAYGMIPLFVVALLSAVDEMVTLIRQERYDPNAKGFFATYFR